MKSTIIITLLATASAQISSEWGRPSTRKNRSLQIDGSMSLDFSMPSADALDASMSTPSFIPPVDEEPESIAMDEEGNVISAIRSSAAGLAVSGAVAAVVVGGLALL
jgi:hypothetical protein